MHLEDVLRSMAARKGVEAVVFLDRDGETVLSYGIQDSHQLQLLGAYQSILLMAVSRMGFSKESTVVTIYDSRSVLTHQLKDGYFISVIFNQELPFGYLHFWFEEAYSSVRDEI